MSPYVLTVDSHSDPLCSSLSVQYQVNNLEQKKQVQLLGNLEGYWSSYSSFAAAQSTILSQHHIEKEVYSPPSQIEVYQPSQPQQAEPNGFSPIDDQKDSLMDSYAADTPQQNGSGPPPAFGGGMDGGMGGIGMGGGMPPPNNDSQSGFEYYHEEAAPSLAQNGQNNNVPQDDYNPFDD